MPTQLSDFLQRLANETTDAALLVREAGSILRANTQAYRLLRYGPGELNGLNVELLLPERFRLEHIRHRLRFTDDRRARPMGGGRDLLAQCKDGTELTVRISLAPLYHGLETLMLVVIRDSAPSA